jgi:hypothetical protein
LILSDDGSSLCCCWADDARAELMLRLQEVAHLDASVGLKLSKDGSSTNLQFTIGSCLEKTLKKHTSITVRNYGIPPDFSCRDLGVSSVSGKILSHLEEKLLKFITLNACWKGTLVSLSIIQLFEFESVIKIWHYGENCIPTCLGLKGLVVVVVCFLKRLY